MRTLLYIISLLCISAMYSCENRQNQVKTLTISVEDMKEPPRSSVFEPVFIGHNYDSLYTTDVIRQTCAFMSDTLKPGVKVVEYFDSIALTGGYFIVSNAERDLDTVVNHVPLKFVRRK